MIAKNKLTRVFSVIATLAVIFSSIQPPAAQAQGPGDDGLKRQVNPESGRVSFISPASGRALPAGRALGQSFRPQDPALALAVRYAPEFGLKDPGRHLRAMETERSDEGRITARYQQIYQDVPVMGGELIVNTNGSGDLYSISGEVSPDLSLSTQPTVTPDQARQAALQGMAAWYGKSTGDFTATEPALWIYDASLLQPGRGAVELTWRMEVTAREDSLPVRELVLVNARRGTISLHFNQLDTAWKNSARPGTARAGDQASTRRSAVSRPPVPDKTKSALVDQPILYVSTTGNDANPCSATGFPCATINGALAKAAWGSIIRVTSGTYMGSGTSSNIVVISKSITLLGGWDNTFSVQNGVSILDGSGLRNSIVANGIGSQVFVESFVVRNSYSTMDAGGISIYGAHFTLNNSSVIHNTARGNGGGIYLAGNGSLTVSNSTISGNNASSSGGGIHAVNGTVEINNSTIVYNNSGATGGGLAAGIGTVSLRNSILARNTASTGGPDCSGWVTSSDHNIVGNTAGCSLTGGPGNQLDVDPLVEASPEGAIPYHALQPASPAIEGGDDITCLATDQRNMARPQGSACDIGAYEATPEGRLLAESGSGQAATVGYPFEQVLTASVLDPSGNPAAGVTVTFTAPASGASGTFADTGTNVTSATTDNNGRASTPLLTASTSTGPYTVLATADGHADVASFLLNNVNALYAAPGGSDSNSCLAPGQPCRTLNGAIDKALPGDRIFAAGGTYTGSGSEVARIAKSLTLSGGWDDSFSVQGVTSVIDGEGARRGISVMDFQVSIDHFTIQNGRSYSGGGIDNSRGTLLLNDMVVTGNKGTGSGSGIENYGTLTINNTTINGNQTGSSGGSGGGGGSIENYSGTVVMNNSTISGNVLLGGFLGSGIQNNGTFILNNSTVSGNLGDDAIAISSGTLTLNNSTVYNNAYPGIYNSYGTVYLQNTILANNSTAWSGQDCSGTITSLGHNLIGKISACTLTPAAGDQVNVNPLLSPSLVGSPAYHALQSSSPAIDAGNPATCLPTDQRGIPRPQGAACDIGAYEYTPQGGAASLGIASGNNQRTGLSSPFPLPLSVYVVDEVGGPVSGVEVTFTAPGSGPSGVFAGTGTNTATVPVDAEGIAISPAFTANAERGIYEVLATVPGVPAPARFLLTNSTLFVAPFGNDGNSCDAPGAPCLTLSAAINKAGSIDAIKLASGSYTGVTIQKSLTISGGWNNEFTSQTGFSTISGYSGIIADAPNISLSRLIVRDSHFGIYHQSGTLQLDQSALIYNATGFHNAGGDATLTNTTLSGNHASTGSGSAIMNMNGSIRVQFSTITNNTGDYAIRSQVTSSGEIEIGNSILAGNSPGDCYIRYDSVISAGHNIFGAEPVCPLSRYFFLDPTDRPGTDPLLSALFPVGYHSIPSNSPAVGTANPDSCPPSDQRGVARPQGGPCDIGAYEYAPPGAAASFGILSGADQHAGLYVPVHVPLAIYVIDAAGSPVGGAHATFTAPASGPSGSFADTGTNTTSAVTGLDGTATAAVFTTNSQPGSYAVTATVSGLPSSVSFGLTNMAWFVSTSGSDANSCNTSISPCRTIDAALNKAAEGDGILVTTGTYSSAWVTKSVTILGGWDATFSAQTGASTIDGNVTNHGIYASAPHIAISRFVVQNSNYGIQHDNGTLTFDRGALVHNNNGLYNSAGGVTLTNSTISGNDAHDRNGLLQNGSAILNSGGVVRIRYSTIAANTGDYAIRNTNQKALVEIGNSILAGNEGGDCYIDGHSMTSTGHNILGSSPACSGVGGFIPDPTDQVGIDPHVLSLLPMGYVPISSGSPAVDRAGADSCPAADQRAMVRPQGGACDIGAYEYATPGAPAFIGVLSGSNQHTGDSLPFDLPLVAYVVDASGSPVGGVQVSFSAPASGPSGTFADTGTHITTVVTNEAGLALSPVFTANALLGTYIVTATIPGLPPASFTLTNANWYVSPAGNDGNSCNATTSPCLTINAAINKATDGDAVHIAVGTYPPVVVTKNLTLLGGWDATFSSQTGFSTVDGNYTSNGISAGGRNVSISRFIVQNSHYGISHSGSGTLHFERGASINNNNGVYNDGGETFLINTTISGNHSKLIEGYIQAGSAVRLINGRVRIQFSTITNNGGTQAIEIWNDGARVEIGNSILAGNPRSDCDGEGSNILSLGHNLFGSSPVCQSYGGDPFAPDPTDQVGADPRLGALYVWAYHTLRPNSPAIDAADPLACPAVDQRGLVRPIGMRCDIGAVEYNLAATLPRYIFVLEGSPQIITTNKPAATPLVAVVFDEDGDSVPGTTVKFTAPGQGVSAVFADTGTSTTTAVTDINGFAVSFVFSANNLAGSYFIDATVEGIGTPARFSLSNSSITLLPYIQTYTADNYTSLPGRFLCDRTRPGCTHGFDLHADAAHRHAIGTYALYAIKHSRNSINEAGMMIVSSVHYSSGYDNAVWTGSQMVYGDIHDYPLADDVVAHELTHGVTDFESNLFYYYQSGAINESFSDLWGEYYDQINSLGNDRENVKWLVGEDVVNLGALRNMSNPPAYGDPDKMSSANYYKGTLDNGGVHTNSGVNNKAVSLLVDGGTFNGRTVPALGWDKTAALYYEANTRLLTSGADYADLYFAIQQACTNLTGQKGITSGDCLAVREALEAVEMNVQLEPNSNTDIPPCTDPGTAPRHAFLDDLEFGPGYWTFTNGKYLRWQYDSTYGSYAHSGDHFLYADDYPGDITDASTRMIPITIPNNAYLHFAHAYDFEGDSDDGGVLEYSLDGGTTWSDAGSLMDFNGYNGTIRTGPGDNPLQGRSAFVNSSHGYISTRLNLSSLAGKSVTFRWRMGLDIAAYSWGWWLDDVRIYQCLEPDIIHPTVSSIARAGSQTTSAPSVDFIVTFGEPVSGVNNYDFNLAVTGQILGAHPTVVTAAEPCSGTLYCDRYKVTVTTGAGIGRLRLDLIDDDSIRDRGNLPLGGSGKDNGSFTNGESYNISRGPTFTDVPLNHPYWKDIEVLYANGLTGGCSTNPLKFCPDQIMNRGQAAVFILRANFGSSYVPPVPTHIFKDDWSKGTWAEPWAEGMRNAGLSAGCLSNPLKYCPWDQIPREQAVIFALRMKYGTYYLPPPATGTVFADMTNPSYYATSWAEQAYKEEIIPSCGTSGGKPKICPKDLVSRGLAAYMIVRAKNLSIP